MPSYGRHRVFALFWTWSLGPFVCMTDLATAGGSKSTSGLQRCKLQIHPRPVPRVVSGRVRRTELGYLDVLRPNDWVFVFVDPMDGDAPEPLFMGFIDDVRANLQVPSGGASSWSIQVSCSGWEKALQNTSCISDAWVSSAIHIGTMYDIAIRTMDNQTIPLVGHAIAAIVRTFLDAEGTEEFLQRQANDFRSREDMSQEEIDDLVARLTGVQEDSPVSPEQPTQVSGEPEITALMGQFELPQTRTPLWYFIKMKFEDLPDRTFAMPKGIVSMLGMPLSRFIDEWANSLMNVLIYDVRRISNDGASHISEARGNLMRNVSGGYLESAIDSVIGAANSVSGSIGKLFGDIAPHMILMRRPLFTDELEVLDGPTLDSKDMSHLNIGISDSDHYNLSWVEPTSLDTSGYRAATGLTGVDSDRPRAIDMIRRHGLRIYQDQTACWPDNSAEGEPPSVPRHDPEFFRDWNERIQRAGLDQVNIFTGDCSIHKFVRGLYLGGKLIINIERHPGIVASGSQRVFYVDGYDWSYNAQNGQFDTNVSLTRGYDTQRRGAPSPF